MAGKSTISITFKLEGDGKGFRALAQDANGLKKVLTETISEAQRLNTGAINFAAIATGIGQAQQSIAALQSALKGLTDAYAVQVQAETQLETVMRQRMGASDEDVQAIKNLASAQQELGVIGDEVQLSGAQQMATFLTQRQSIETLLPAMNNLLAQQKGLNATTSDAVTVGNLMGKAMQGQTAALRRVGITFDESQEKIMKYGTEAQRAAMLAQIIQQNVGDMNAQLAATDAGKQKQLDNTLGDIKEKLGGLAQGAMPFVTITANTMLALAGVIKFAAGVKAASAAVAGWSIKNKIATALLRLSGLSAKQAAVGVNVLSSAHKSAAVSAHLLKGAIHGLMIATGVGIIIAGLTSVIEYFTSSADDAADSVGHLTEAEQIQQRVSEATSEANKAGAEANALAKIQIQGHIQAIREFNGTKEEEQKLLDELRLAYGDFMGDQASLSGWYDTLTAKSEDYCRQMVQEAKTAKYKDKIIAAEAAFEEKWGRHGYEYTRNTTAADGRASAAYHRGLAGISTNDGHVTGASYDDVTEKNRQKRIARIRDGLADDAEYIDKLYDQMENSVRLEIAGRQRLKTPTVPTNSPSAVSKKISEKSIDELNAQKTILEGQLQKSNPGEDVSAKVEEYKQVVRAIESRQRALGLNRDGKSTTTTKKVVEGSNLSREQLSTNIELYTKKLTGEDTEEQRVMRKKIQSWRKAIDKIDLATRAAQRPQTLDTLKDIDEEISYQQFLRQRADADAIAGIDKEIARLNALKHAMEIKGQTSTPIEEITTYRQLGDEISRAEDLMQTATADERIQIQKRINELQKLKAKWDEVRTTAEAPKDIKELNTLEDIEKAIRYYEARQKRASGDEIAENAKVIASYYRKRDALKRGIDIVDMKSEADAINSLTGREYKVKIRSMGFDELTAKIAELQKALNDTENPLTATQRKDIEDLIGVYERWRSEVVNTFGTYRDGYNGLKNVGSGVQSITDALEGNGNAWQKITAIIDGFLEVYDGISAIVGIINMLTTASQTHTAAKTAEAAAVVVATGAQAAEAPIAGAVAAAQTPVIAANEAVAASYMKMASAAFFAAHASIPFAGFGIAAGFTAAAAAIVSSVGKVVAMPFAEGGIVTGPTLGYIGEYAGASNNPEVVAPLDKLRTLIEPRDAMAGRVEFEIDGRKLRGVLQRVNNVSNRS